MRLKKKFFKIFLRATFSLYIIYERVNWIPRRPRGRFLREINDTPGTVDTSYTYQQQEKEHLYANN